MAFALDYWFAYFARMFNERDRYFKECESYRTAVKVLSDSEAPTPMTPRTSLVAKQRALSAGGEGQPRGRSGCVRDPAGARPVVCAAQTARRRSVESAVDTSRALP